LTDRSRRSTILMESTMARPTPRRHTSSIKIIGSLTQASSTSPPRKRRRLILNSA
jgi:hypothetical protein